MSKGEKYMYTSQIFYRQVCYFFFVSLMIQIKPTFWIAPTKLLLTLSPCILSTIYVKYVLGRYSIKKGLILWMTSTIMADFFLSLVNSSASWIKIDLIYFSLLHDSLQCTLVWWAKTSKQYDSQKERNVSVCLIFNSKHWTRILCQRDMRTL